MSEWDKSLIAKAFQVNGDENTECTILIATDAYGMGIDNPDIKLLVQWDLPMSFDSMIQRMGRAGRKRGQATFVLFTPKWTQVKDPTEVEERLAKRVKTTNSQLSNLNRPKSMAKQSPLGHQVESAEDQSDLESAASSDLDEFDDPATTAFLDLLATEVEEDSRVKKSKKRASKSDAEKRAKLPDEIFDYIHAAKCRRLFSLAWYDDLTYAPNAEGLSKALPTLCCNSFSCSSEEPPFLKRLLFIDTTAVKYTEADREWIAYRTAELKKWRKAKSKAFWLEQKVEAEIPDTLLMSDECLVGLAKAADSLIDSIDGSKIKEFLKPWYGLDKYAEELFICLCQSSITGEGLGPTRAARKDVLKLARASKKAKGLDDPVVAKKARITALRDQWLIKQNKSTPALKARLKKAEAAEKKEKARLDKNREKAQEQAQVNDIRKLALTNRQVKIGAFQDILSDPPQAPSALPHSDPPIPVIPTAATQQSVHLMQVTGLQAQSKKRAAAKERASSFQSKLQKTSTLSASTFSRERDLTPPPIQMELIRPGKQKVRIPANAVESSLSKRMRVVS